MKTKNITIKSNDQLTDLLIDRILNVAISKDILYDFKDECGHTLGFWIQESNYSLEQFCLYTFGKCTETIKKFVSELVIWGLDNECPDCGCELDREQYITKCSNCDYWETTEPDYDSMPGGYDYKADLTNVCKN